MPTDTLNEDEFAEGEHKWCKHLIDPATCTICNGSDKRARERELWEVWGRGTD